VGRVQIENKSEDQLQCSLVEYIRKQYKRALFCATVGGVSCGPIEKDRLKRSGYQNGIPDIMFYMARHGYHGLALELKRTKSDKMRPDQIIWMDNLIREGWAHHCSHDIDDLHSWVDWYLGRKKKPTNCADRILTM